MTGTGAKQFAMIFGMSMAIPYASVPVSALLACVQILLAGIRDAGLIEQSSVQNEDADPPDITSPPRELAGPKS